jgi:hypothetical protein
VGDSRVNSTNVGMMASVIGDCPILLPWLQGDLRAT